MKRILLAGLCVLAMGARASTTTAFEAIAVTTSTAVAPAAGDYTARAGIGRGGTDMAFCTVETNNIRFRVDGSSPTVTSGHLVTSGDSFTVTGYGDVRQLKLFGVGSSSSTVNCSFSQLP